MQYLAAELVMLALVGTMLTTPYSRVMAAPVHADPDRHIIVEAEEPMDAMVIWLAISRYSDVDLELPPLRIVVHDDAAGCQGNRGRFTRTEERGTVDICSRHANPRVEIRWRLRAAVHELAHAFTSATFVEEDVNEFVTRNELESWLSRKSLWEEQGAEVAAESVVWGLGIEPDIRMNPSCDVLLDNYRTVTGTQPVPEAFENCR